MSDLPEKVEKMPMSELARMAKAAADAGYSKSAGSAGVQLATAQSLGLSPMSGLFSIYEVKGRPMLSSKLLLGLINNHPSLDYEFVESDEQRATIAVFRKSKRDGAWKEAGRVTYTMDDAKKAGVTSNPTWKSHPKRMLAYRATSEAVSLLCPEVAMDLPVGEPEYETYAPVRADIGEVAPLPEDAGESEPITVSEAEDDVVVVEIEVEDEVEPSESSHVEDALVEDDGAVVSISQQKSMWAQARKSIPEDTEATVKRLVKWLCRVESSKEIPAVAYDTLMATIRSWPEAEPLLVSAEKENN